MKKQLLLGALLSAGMLFNVQAAIMTDALKAGMAQTITNLNTANDAMSFYLKQDVGPLSQYMKSISDIMQEMGQKIKNIQEIMATTTVGQAVSKTRQATLRDAVSAIAPVISRMFEKIDSPNAMEVKNNNSAIIRYMQNAIDTAKKTSHEIITYTLEMLKP